MSQQIVLLSLPLLSMRDDSWTFQAIERTPLECPDSSLTGETLFLRSQSWRAGDRSSSDATIS